MLKLTRHLYQWTGDPRYFDYYERTLLNHRIAAIDRETGATQYYLSIYPGAWKTFNTENDSFWCCTGTGVEEFSKLNDSIYFHDGNGLYVNLFIPSELNWSEKGLKIRQETNFPETADNHAGRQCVIARHHARSSSDSLLGRSGRFGKDQWQGDGCDAESGQLPDYFPAMAERRPHNHGFTDASAYRSDAG